MSYIPMSVDFSKYTNLPQEDYGVIEVRFGADSPLLEVELNEAQILSRNFMKNFILNYFGNGILEVSNYNYDTDNNVFMLDNMLIFFGGNLIRLIGDRVSIPNDSNVVLNVREVMKTFNDTLYPYGNMNLLPSDDNYLVDPRLGCTTSNRTVLEFKISSQSEEGFNSMVIGVIENNEFKPKNVVPDIYKLVHQKTMINAGNGLQGGGSLATNIDLSVKKNSNFLVVDSLGISLKVDTPENLLVNNLTTILGKLTQLSDKDYTLSLKHYIEIIEVLIELNNLKFDKSNLSDSTNSSSSLTAATSKALMSAMQLAQSAKDLADNNKLNKIDYLDIVNDLITGGARKALSADMGVVLNARIDSIVNGGARSLYLNSEEYGERRFTGTLNAGSKDISISKLIYNPTLYLGGIRIPNELFTVDLATGHISLKKPYDSSNNWEWEVIDKYPYHIDFCYPTLNLLLNSEAKNDIVIDNVIKILGETTEDDGDHRLVKCESRAGLNAVTLAPGKYLNEIPNTRPKSKLDRGGYNGTAQDIINMINNLNVCPYRVGDILTTKNSGNPAVTWTGTTWKKLEGRFLLGTSGSQSSGSTGGASTVTLTSTHLPVHNHGISVSLGNSGNHYHQGGNHRHQVDNHAHTQPAHSHSYKAPWTESSGGYFSPSGGAYPVNNRTSGSAGGDNTGGSAPYTNYQNPNTSTNGDHNHSVSASSANAGSGNSFSILPPYETVHMWERLT